MCFIADSELQSQETLREKQWYNDRERYLGEHIPGRPHRYDGQTDEAPSSDSVGHAG